MVEEPERVAETEDENASTPESQDDVETTSESVDDALDRMLADIVEETTKPVVPVPRPEWMSETPIDEPLKPLPGLGAAVISFLLDFPDVAVTYVGQMKFEFFDPGPQWIIAGCICNYLEAFQCIPTREALLDYIFKQITVDDPHEEIREIVMRPSDPRETPFIQQELVKWIKERAYKNALYSDQSMSLILAGNYAEFHKALDEAAMIGETKSTIITCDDLLNKRRIRLDRRERPVSQSADDRRRCRQDAQDVHFNGYGPVPVPLPLPFACLNPGNVSPNNLGRLERCY